jgi:hypothetical protein
MLIYFNVYPWRLIWKLYTGVLSFIGVKGRILFTDVQCVSLKTRTDVLMCNMCLKGSDLYTAVVGVWLIGTDRMQRLVHLDELVLSSYGYSICWANLEFVLFILMSWVCPLYVILKVLSPYIGLYSLSNTRSYQFDLCFFFMYFAWRFVYASMYY